MPRTSPNNITSLTQDWGRDDQTGLPFSGASVQQFIKSHLGAIAKSSWFDPSEAVIYYFASDDDRDAFMNNKQLTTLPLFSTAITFSSDLYRISLTNNNGSTTLNVATNEDTVELSVDFQVQTKAITDTIWTGTNDGVYVTALIDVAGTGNFVPIHEATLYRAGQTYTIDVRSLLREGTGRVKLSFVDEADNTVSSSITYTINLTAMYIEPFEGMFNWNLPIIEGGDQAAYQLGGFRIVGSLNKVLHIDVYSNDTKVHEIVYNVGVETFDRVPFYYTKNRGLDFTQTSTGTTMTTGVYLVSAYLTSGTGENMIISSPVNYNIMYVAEGEALTAKLVCINNVESKVYNYTTSPMFEYSVYNCGSGTASPQIVVQRVIGQSPTVYIDETLSDVDTSTINSYSVRLDWITQETVNLFVQATMTFGNTQTAISSVDNSATFPPVTGYDFYMNAEARSNADINYSKIVNVSNNSNLTPQWVDMSWRTGVDGWTIPSDDELSRNGLYIPAKSKMTLPVTEFQFLRDFQNGMTIEFCYKITNVADYDEPVITIAEAQGADGFKGIKIRPTNILVHSSGDTTGANDLIRGTNVMDETVIHFALAIYPNFSGSGKNLATGYVNGCKAFQFEYGSSTWSTNAPLIIGADRSDVTVYFIRTYRSVLSDANVIANYINSQKTIAARENIYNLMRSVLDANGEAIDFRSVKKNKYNFFVIEMQNGASVPSMANGWSKDSTALSNLEMHFGYHPEWDWKITGVETGGQGTTSMGYWRWNIRWRIDKSTGKKVNVYYLSARTEVDGEYEYTWEDPIVAGTLRFDGADNHPMLKRITAKINFASSMQSHKMGATLAYTELHNALGLNNEAQTFADNNSLPSPVVAVYQYPAFGFVKNGSEYSFIGLFTIGPDKGDKPTFGYDIDSSISSELITLEGSDHNQNVVMFNHPWSSMSYSSSDEFLNLTEYSGSKRGGWEVSNCHGLDTGKSSDEDAIQTVLETEFKPAYDLVFNNSTMIFGIELGEYGSDAASTIAYINNNVVSFGTIIRAGHKVSNSYYQFWIEGDYNLYHLDVNTGRYVSDINLVSEHGTPSGTTVSEQNEWFKTKRRERFMASAENYWDLQDAIFHYCFIIAFGAVDNFGKNTYPYKMATLAHGGRWKWRQDDLDSLAGINNAGADTVPSSAEYLDISATNTPIYGGSQSIFWTLIHECYMADYRSTATLSTSSGIISMGKNMLQAMSSIAGGANVFSGVLNYYKLRFWDNAQNYFPASAYNYDASFKYESAWLAGGDAVQQAQPLPQSLGNHYLAEYFWFYRRTIYLMSMFHAGPFGTSDSSMGRIAFRPAYVSEFTFTPTVDMYPSLSIGQTIYNGERTMAGESYSFRGQFGDGQTTSYIEAANFYSDLGDWKNVQVDTSQSSAVIVNGKKLVSFKIGDATEEVTCNIPALGFNNTPCLESVDARNVDKLTGSVDLTSCPRLQEAYFGGTSVQQVTVADGAKITTLELPDSITRIILKNLSKLTNAGLTLPSDLSNVELLQIVNGNIDAFELLCNIYNSTDSALKNFAIAISGIKEIDSATFHIISNLAQNKNNQDENVFGGYHGVAADGSPLPDSTPTVDGTVQLTAPMHKSDLNIVSNVTDYTTTLKRGVVSALGPLNLIFNPNNLYIIFQDPEVQRILLANGIGDGVGITVEQAAAVTSIGTIFADNAVLERFDELVYFTGITLIPNHAFRNNTSLISLGIPSSVTQINNPFNGTDGIKNLKINDLESFLSMTISQHPFDNNNDTERTIYLNNEVITDLVIPNTIAKINNAFKKCTCITSLTIPSSVTSIGANAFRECTGLTSITIPSSVTSIGYNAFRGCTGLTGTLTLPSSVTSIDQSAFQSCTGLTGIKVLSSQVSFPSLTLNNGTFANCTGIVNMYFACSISTYAFRGSGDGTGTLIVDGVYTNESHDAGAYFASLVVNGDANFTAGTIRGTVWTALVQIRISGNYTNTYTTSTDAYLVRGGNRIKFIEIGGTITHSGTYLISSDALSQSGSIIHFGYDGIALSAPAVISDFSRISKIYVGDGSSAAHDDAILQMYLADTDWAVYSDKLDTWYNYVQGDGEYATPPTIPTE